jgi:DNA invertase Pin-like site-specific DNA recombinase
MSGKITPEHLSRQAVVYIRQSTMTQVLGNLESQRRQYALVEAAKASGFTPVTVIDDDLGRTGSGVMNRPGFEKLVATVCAGVVGAVYCLEASRLARNGRDWHHLIDLCALVGTLVVDHDGVYDPRLVNDRLLLGLKGTMSEYELSLMRQRGIASRDAKAARGELRFTLPPGYCWNEIGKIELDPDEHVQAAIRLVFRKFIELGSGRQVFLWMRQTGIKMPIVQRNIEVYKIQWKAVAYHTVMQILHNPAYAGAYAFGKSIDRIKIVDGRARKTSGHHKAIEDWNALIHDHHEGYITWQQYEDNRRLLLENAHMKKRTARKSARGGRALMTGLLRCGRCGRRMRVFYGMGSGNAHRYQCRGDDGHVGAGLCIGVAGVRTDRTIVTQILEAISDRAVEAAILASDQAAKAADDVLAALEREIEEARYQANLAARRYELVDPAKRHVARELEARWNSALEHVAELEQREREMRQAEASRPKIDRAALLQLANDLPTAWNAPTTDMRTKQRLAHILIQEVIVSIDETAHESVLLVHWTGGRHSELRIPQNNRRGFPKERIPNAVEMVRKLAPHFPDREIATCLNRMRCKRSDGETWTTVLVLELRERLGLSAHDPSLRPAGMISLIKAAEQLKICIGSARKLVEEGYLPATQIVPGATWLVPLKALDSETVKAGVQMIASRRPRTSQRYQDDKVLRIPVL